MKSCDTNILLYYFDEGCSEHQFALKYLVSIKDDPDFVICDLVLSELFVLLQNKKVFAKPRSTIQAWQCCMALRSNPRWQVLECKEGAMKEVWSILQKSNSRPTCIYDYRLGFTLKMHGVTEFATRNTRDFKAVGFQNLINPIDG